MEARPGLIISTIEKINEKLSGTMTKVAAIGTVAILPFTILKGFQWDYYFT